MKPTPANRATRRRRTSGTLNFGIQSPNKRNGKSKGYALIMTLIMAALSLIVLAGTMSRTTTDSNLNARNGQYNASVYAAEAATEKALARMQFDFMNGGEQYISNKLDTYRSVIPTGDDDPYWNNFEFSNGQGGAAQTYIHATGLRSWQPVQSQFANLYGWATMYRILSNTKQTNGRFDLTTGVQQDVELDAIPVFQHAIFYNGLLEFTWCAPMKVNGPTHANGDIFVGSASDLTFNSSVTATGDIVKTNWDNHSLSSMNANVNFNGTPSPGKASGQPTLELPIGTNTGPAVRQLIEIPPAGEDPNSAVAQQRYYDKAEVVILVTDGLVTVTLKVSPTDPNPVILSASFTDGTYSPTQGKVIGGNYSNVTNVSVFPFISLNQSFTDQRENKVVLPTQLDVGGVVTWLNSSVVQNKFPASAGVYPNIFYVADLRSRSSSQMPAIRLVNGGTIPKNLTATGVPTGWTLSTRDPLYVQGDFNNPSGTQSQTTPDPNRLPASLVSDALTILSARWSDAASSGSVGNRTPQNTTINAAILTGVVYTTATTWTDDTHFSGGVHNLPRLLENWSNGTTYTLNLNTSIVNFFGSQIATNFFRNPGAYYYAPNRNYNFDINFTNPNKLPPGTPCVGQILRTKWTVVPPNTVDYAGN